MSIPFIIVSALVLVVCAAMVGLILAQQKNASAGFGASMTGMGGSGDSYWSSNKGRSIEGQLAKYTKICAFLFFVLVLVSNLIK
jgi:preprotein translocase subunit SecG